MRSGTDQQIDQRAVSPLVAAHTEFTISGSSQDNSSQLLQHHVEDADDADKNDFEAATIAKTELQKVIRKFDDDAKISKRQQVGLPHKSSKAKAVEVLQQSVDKDIDSLKASIDSLEDEWKQKHGPVFAALKKICHTLDDHKGILKVFPSQNNYASLLVGSVTILMKAAKSHSEIALNLSKSIAEISEKVATCSLFMTIIRTSRTRKKLAEIYARMFRFYQETLEWYLQSRFGRFVRSFNENLLKSFEDAKKDLEDSINELYREAAIANTAMVSAMYGKVNSLEAELYRQRQSYEARDTLAGKRLEKMIGTTWSGLDQVERMIELLERAAPQILPAQDTKRILPPNEVETLSSVGLNPFILGEQLPPIFSKGSPWVLEKTLIYKLQTWIKDNAVSRTMWISSPYNPSARISGASVALSAVVSAAWQVETPLLTAFCKRPNPEELRPGMSTEQIGLISIVYRLIQQLLQFKPTANSLTIDKKDLGALNGEASSWDASLKLLRTLLQNVPDGTFCAIDNLNVLESGSGKMWCGQLLDVLKGRQLQADSSFNILFSTNGQSSALPQHTTIRDRCMAPKAKDSGRMGKGATLQLRFD